MQPEPSTDAQPSGPLTWIAMAIAMMLAVVSIGQMWRYGARMPGIDYYQFWVVGTELREGHADAIYSVSQRAEFGKKWLEVASQEKTSRLYSAARRREQLETFSTPWLYTLFAWSVTGDYERDYKWFLAGSMTISVAAIVAICRSFRVSVTMTALWVAFCFGCFQPLKSDVAVGNVNQLQLGGIALYILSQSRMSGWKAHLSGGLILGLMIAFKPNLGFAFAMLMAFWIASAAWGKLLGQMIGSFIALGLAISASSMMFGTVTCWVQWTASLSELMGTQNLPIEAGNFSPSALLQHLGRSGHSQEFLPALSLLMMIVIVSDSFRRTPISDQARRDQDVLIMGLGTIVMLLGSKLAWVHYFELLIPAAIYCVTAGLSRAHSLVGSRDGLMAVIAVLLVALIPVKWVIGFHNFTLPAVLCLLGTVMLAVQLVRELRSLRHQSTSLA